MMKSVGDCRLAATVWPTSTLRWMTMPSIGAVMMQWSRLTWLWLTEPAHRACDRLRAPASDCSCACAESTAILAASRSLCGTRLRAASSFAPRELLLRVGQRDLVVDSPSLATSACDLTQIGARLLHLRLEERRIEPRDHLALVDDRVEVGAEPRDVARHLAADLHRRDRLQRAGGADRVDDLAAGHRRRCSPSPRRRCAGCSKRRRRRRWPR